MNVRVVEHDLSAGTLVPLKTSMLPCYPPCFGDAFLERARLRAGVALGFSWLLELPHACADRRSAETLVGLWFPRVRLLLEPAPHDAGLSSARQRS